MFADSASQHAFQPDVYNWRLEHILLVVLKPLYQGMADLGTWAYKQTKICVDDDDSQTPVFIRTARDFKDEKRDLRFSLKDLWAESVLLLVAGE